MLREFFIAFIISIDIYLAAAACCNSGIRIPLSSAFIIDIFSTAVMFASLSLSDLISGYITSGTCHRIGTAVLIALGAVNITKSIVRNFIRRISDRGGFSVKMGGASILVRLYLDDTAADMDSSKVLSAGEAAVLAVAGSLDAAASGLGCGCTDISAPIASVFTFICGAAALMLGSLTGRKISSLRHDLSWAGGLLLILFAVFSA
ncbi:MAG: manganese efflux pump [Ruminococcus sp.]|uniref:manganese efflux pump n=1 Tax=Ruminococcus sp. TaxID=41978 RepID=UPI001B66229C|nr:manganese efflux pump [Ruminococcus sp.]MBP5578980.1 manganese efflux pump [Ruminococcus sp.]